MGVPRPDTRWRGHLIHDQPQGGQVRGWWRITSVDPPLALEFADGFANSDGTVNTELPTTTVRVRLSTHNGGTRMELRTNYESRETMEQMLRMGQSEGLQAAVGQMNALLVPSSPSA